MINNNVKVSVIIAAFNAERYLGECFEDLLNQTYQNIEIIVCDDCSSDRTAEIIQEYKDKDKRIISLRNTSNCYAGQSRNNCFEIATGDYYMIQDADDRAKPNRIEVLLNTIISSNVDFVSSGMFLFDERGIYKYFCINKEKPTKYDFLPGLPFCHAATLFTKNCINGVKGYRVSKETRHGQDYDLFFRLYAAGYRGINIRSYLYGYRVDRETISRRKFEYRVDECKIRIRGYRSLDLLPLGYLFCLKPILSYFVQKIKGNRG